MTYRNWNEWLALRESNARKRSVKNALNGTGPKLPGSYATCPSTNALAVKVADKSGVVKKLKTENEQKPDYSFDRWVQMAQELGDDTNKLVGHAKVEDDKLDKAKEEKEKAAKTVKPEKPEKQPVEPKDPEEEKANKETWKKLKTIHNDRNKNTKSDKTPKKEE